MKIDPNSLVYKKDLMNPFLELMTDVTSLKQFNHVLIDGLLIRYNALNSRSAEFGFQLKL